MTPNDANPRAALAAGVVLVLEVDAVDLAAVVRAIPDGVVSWGGDFATPAAAAAALSAEAARRAAPPPE